LRGGLLAALFQQGDSRIGLATFALLDHDVLLD
jgi:hypothetical protein